MSHPSDRETALLATSVKDAFDYAFDLHAHQCRKGTDIPYVSHLMSVAALTLESGGRDAEVMAAFLHDAVEDQGGEATLREIKRRFGERVAWMVDGCTDSCENPKPDWRVRKERYVARIAEAPLEIKRISICDKLHNIRCTVQEYRQEGEALWDKFSGKRDLIDWYYPMLLQAYRVQSLPTGLAAFVEEIEHLANFLQDMANQQAYVPEGPFKRDRMA